MKTIRIILSVAVAGCVFNTVSLLGVDAASPNAFKKPLSSVPVLELPAKAASLVKKASDQDQDATAIAVVEAVSDLKPASVPVVVSAIAKASPGQAPAAAAAAAQKQPDLAAAVVRAAAAAAPGQVKQIVAAVCRKAPAQYQAIAISAAEAVPSASADILGGLVAAIPSLAGALEDASTAAGVSPVAGGPGTLGLTTSKPSDVRSFLRAAKALRVSNPDSSNPSPNASTPVVGAPFDPPPPVIVEINPGSTHPVLPGGRNYARP